MYTKQSNMLPKRSLKSWYDYSRNGEETKSKSSFRNNSEGADDETLWKDNVTLKLHLFNDYFYYFN